MAGTGKRRKEDEDRKAEQMVQRTGRYKAVQEDTIPKAKSERRSAIQDSLDLRPL